jgi:hypothetical protein
MSGLQVTTKPSRVVTGMPSEIASASATRCRCFSPGHSPARTSACAGGFRAACPNIGRGYKRESFASVCDRPAGMKMELFSEQVIMGEVIIELLRTKRRRYADDRHHPAVFVLRYMTMVHEVADIMAPEVYA